MYMSTENKDSFTTEPTGSYKDVTDEQKRTAKLMDEAVKHEEFLRKNKNKFPNFNTEMFHRLPLSDIQRKELYAKLMMEYNKTLKSNE